MARTFGERSGRDAYNRDHVHVFQRPAADAAASTATAETPFFAAAAALTIKSIDILPGAALTADATDNATITIRRRNADGTSAASVAALTTNVAGGSWTQWVSKSMGTISNGTLSAGQILTLQITKAGSGVAIPICAIRVVYNFA